MYAIKWKSNITGFTGSGLFIFNKKTAEEICGIANRDNPDVNHWCEVGEPED